jgi:hypothetical protein
VTVTAPARLNARRGFHPSNFTHREPDRQALPTGKVVPFLSAQTDRAQHILMVEFSSPDGRHWKAIGGGDTLADAIAYAQDSCPTDASWQPISWNDLYGD